MTAYAYLLSQTPVIIAHLRDSMVMLGATVYDRDRVDTSREQTVPFRLDAMVDADTLWDALTSYSNEIALAIRPAPHALTARLRASQAWNEAGDAAYTISAWLTGNEERIAQLTPSDAADLAADHLFDLIRRLLARYRIEPRRLRTHTRQCLLCGEPDAAVYAEWSIGRDGQVEHTEQCVVCGERYDADLLPSRASIVTLPEWRPPAWEST